MPRGYTNCITFTPPIADILGAACILTGLWAFSEKNSKLLWSGDAFGVIGLVSFFIAVRQHRLQRAHIKDQIHLERQKIVNTGDDIRRLRSTSRSFNSKRSAFGPASQRPLIHSPRPSSHLCNAKQAYLSATAIAFITRGYLIRVHLTKIWSSVLHLD